MPHTRVLAPVRALFCKTQYVKFLKAMIYTQLLVLRPLTISLLALKHLPPTFLNNF